MKPHNKQFKAFLGVLVGLGIIGANFYTRYKMGFYDPITVVIGGAIAAICAVSIVKPDFQDAPTTEEHKKAVNAAGLIGAAFGAILWLFVLR